MKKIISLILVVLLCLPAVFIPVSAAGADTYTITAVTGADTTSNDYLNIEKYLAYYDGGDTLSVPEGYITVAQWKANIQNPTINANGVADADYITSDCTLTLTMDDGVTTKEVAIDAVDYNYLYKEYDKKQTTTHADMKLLLGVGSNGTASMNVVNVSGDEYGLEYSWVTTGGTDATKSRWYQTGTELKDIKANVTTPYVIEQTIVANAPGTSQVTLLFSYGGSQQANMSSSPVKTKILSGEPFTISAHIFPKTMRADYYLDGVLIKENLSITGSKNGVATNYNNYGQWGIRVINDTKVDGEYKDSSFVITDYQIRNGFGPVDAEIYIAPEIKISNYTDGAKVSVDDVLNVIATTNVDGYNTAELYVNGTKVKAENITSKSVSFSSSYLKAGDNELEVIMYKNGKNPVSSGKVTVTVEGAVTIDGLTDGMLIYYEEFAEIIKATVNTDGYSKAELYVNDTLIEEASVSNKEVYFVAGDLEVGKNKIEVRMYPAKGEYISKTVTITISDVSASELFEIVDANGADTSSNDYINIKKYLAYMENDELSIPANYITVGQWKANIANPAINAEGLSDSDYITSDCTLTWTAADGVATKPVSVYTAGYNYLYEEFDNTKPINVDSANSNNLKINVGMGSNGTLTKTSKDLGDGTYSLEINFDDFTGTSNPWNQILQDISDINSDINTPYMIDMDLKFNNAESYGRADFGFIGSREFDGKQRAYTSLTGFKGQALKGDKIRFTAVVYPEANVADLYLNGNIIKENHSLVFTDALGTSEYDDYVSLFIRFYNTTKVDGEYKPMNYEVSRYEIKYGYGNIDDEIYVAPYVDIVNYTDGAKITTEDIVAIEAVTNSDDMKTAALYIDGVKVDEVAVSNKAVVLDMSSLGYGDHSVEVRMYPEIGAYVSKSITISVVDFIDLSDYTITFDEFDVGETPASIAKPADHFGATSFINYSNESLEDSSVIVNDAYVEYYDDVRGNVFHTKADLASNTEKSGRRIEIMQSNTANNMAVNFDIMFESFTGTTFTFLETRGTGVNAAVVVGADGLLTMYGTTTSETKSIQLEEGVWYNFNAEFYCTMGGIVKLNVYDESGSLVGSMESVNGAPYTDRVRIYTPYNKNNLQSGEAYIDNVKTTIISKTGSIGEITATEDDINTVTAVLNGVSTVDGVEIVSANGEVGILGYTYNIDDAMLTLTTTQPLDVYGAYTLKVYADGYGVPITLGFGVTTAGVKVIDMYFDSVRSKGYIVLDILNGSDSTKPVTILVSKWSGNTLVSMESKTISVDAGENEYRVEYTNNEGYALKVMAVKSLAKPTLVSNGIITK